MHDATGQINLQPSALKYCTYILRLNSRNDKFEIRAFTPSGGIS